MRQTIKITPDMVAAAARVMSDSWGICGFDEAKEIVEDAFRQAFLVVGVKVECDQSENT